MVWLFTENLADNSTLSYLKHLISEHFIWLMVTWRALHLSKDRWSSVEFLYLFIIEFFKAFHSWSNYFSLTKSTYTSLLYIPNNIWQKNLGSIKIFNSIIISKANQFHQISLNYELHCLWLIVYNHIMVKSNNIIVQKVWVTCWWCQTNWRSHLRQLKLCKRMFKMSIFCHLFIL